MMAVDVNLALEIADCFCQFLGSFLRNAIVPERKMNVSQTVFLRDGDVRLSTVHTDNCFDTELIQIQKRLFALRLPTGNHPGVNLNCVGKMRCSKPVGVKHRTGIFRIGSSILRQA